MLDRTTAVAAAVERQSNSSLTGRRALFALLVIATMAAVLWLAIVAVPPTSLGGIAFLILFAITLPWSVVGFWNAAIGFLVMRFAKDPAAAVNPMADSIRGDEPITSSAAILMCIRNESPDQVIRNLEPLIEGLVRAGVEQQFHVYILSDSSYPEVIDAEATQFNGLIAKWQSVLPITYRRRTDNAGFKSGNIRDFCERWGHQHDFALVLDADSFMPAETVMRLVRIAQANPTLGILQTLVVGMPSVSVFARVFQFGMRLGMRSYTLGSAWWQGDCGPYWGHNAIIRLAPFIAHCGLPLLPGTGPLSGHVLSHDQVEAALMRRAGYEVRVLPVDGVSWEENPPTLMEFSRRDLRWCHGNMQYWQLLTFPGLKPVSRFQLAFAIWMYLGSPAWMAMTAIGTVLLALSETSAARYVPVKAGAGTALFAIMMVMTFEPKIATVIDVLLKDAHRRSFGGLVPFALNLTVEALFMLLLAPIVALSHTIFMVRLFLLRRGTTWNSQARVSHAVPWRLAFAKLWPQTLAGCTVLGVVTLKSPNDFGFALVGTSGLILAAPFAVATASPLMGSLFARIGIARIPEEHEHPEALLPLALPAIEINAARRKSKK
jgi:membrane glycosyltransferase